MRFGIQTVGSEGDVRPLIALGAGLRAAGHDVTIAIHDVNAKDYGALCRSIGLDHIDHRGPRVDALALSSANPHEWPAEFDRQFWKADDNEEAMFEIGVRLSESNDVLVSHSLSYPSKAAALETGVPHVAVHLTHEHTPTKHRPPMTAIPSLGERLNPRIWAELDGLYHRLARPFIEPFWERRRTPFPSSLASLRFSDRLNLLALPSVLCEPQEDWGDLHVVTGTMRIAERSVDGSLPAALRDFLDSGSPPVFMGFGSTQQIYPDTNLTRNMDLLLGAALRLGYRAIVQVPVDMPGAHEVNKRFDRSDDVFLVERIPYGEVFRHCAAVVHHGGAGTCDLALRSGRPSLIVPFTYHQFFLGYEMHRVGAALPPHSFHEVTPTGLACSIRQLLQHSGYAERTAALSEEVEREDGVGRAVEIIERGIESGRLRR